MPPKILLIIKMELKCLGHASWQIKTGDKTIYLDPYEGEYKDKADIILCSHHHDDHCNKDKINKILKESTKVIGTEECSKKLDSPITTLKPGELTQIDKVTIQAVEAYNIKK
jgi:L-ascorbate metabolism protein UlaG (beta-lactamase superfamily)